MTPFADHFSTQAAEYSRFRPRYPPALFDWLADTSPGRRCAVDVGCGNGQASEELATRFSRVVALEPSFDQLLRCRRPAGLGRARGVAEALPVRSAVADLLVASQAAHWFDMQSFAAEARRVGRPGALVAVWSYGLLSLTPEVDAAIRRFHDDVVGPWWQPGSRDHVESGYRTLSFPFDELTPPSFAMTAPWSLERLLGYVGSWSAVARYRRDLDHDPLPQLAAELSALWGPPDLERLARWPLVVRSARL